jgi:Polysaccharide deacetylase
MLNTVRRPIRVVGCAIALFLAAGGVAHASGSATRAGAQHPTIVSIEFDDGIDQQYLARGLLARDHMHGTFFVNTGNLGSGEAYMTWSQVAGLARDGNEIADHGVIHVALAPLSVIEQAREICDDRANLFAHGYQSTDFAYPYGSHTQATESIVKNCGYNSARQVGGLDSPGCCVESERTPPLDLYSTRSVVLNSHDTPGSMMRYVTSATGKGGGWVQLVFHQLCNGCSPYAVSPAKLGELLDWLASLRSQGVEIKTVRQVIGGSVQPVVKAPYAPPVLDTSNLLQNPSLETHATGKNPDCWEPHEWGDGVASFSRTSSAHSGSYAERVNLTKVTEGGARLTVARDLGQCSPSVISGHRYVMGTWYESTAPVYFVTYYRSSNGFWNEWMSSPKFPASGGWSHAEWTTPPVVSGATAVSFGLTLNRVGSLTTDDYSLSDVAHRASSAAPWGLIAAGVGLAVVLAAVGLIVLRSRRKPAVERAPAEIS